MVDDNEIGLMLTVREVAQLLSLHTNTVRRWSDLGIIRAYRINDRGDRRFQREEIIGFLAKLHANAGDERKAKLTQAADVETSWERFVSQIVSIGED